MFGVGLPEILLFLSLGAAIFLAEPLAELARRFGWTGLDEEGHREDIAESRRGPYRASKAPPPDPLAAEVARLRRSLLLTRVVAVAAGLTLFGVGRSFAAPLDDAPPRPRPVRPPPPRVVPPSPAPASPAGLPFDSVENPPATIGERFAYPLGLSGYQLPMRFDLPAADPTTAPGPLVSATLELDVELRIIPDQVQGTEGIWIDGVLSGTTWPPFRVPAFISRDLSGRNVAFTEAVTRCCRERRGHLSLPLGVLLDGSDRAVESVLADGRLDVDIADDVEVYRAELVICRRAQGQRGAPQCTAVSARPLASGR